MKSIKILLIIFLFVVTTAFVGTSFITHNPTDPLEKFVDSRYDEAKETYKYLRSMSVLEKIVVSDLEAWKEYEKFQIDSHWYEIVTIGIANGYEIVDVYFNTDENRWFLITVDESGTETLQGCAGMGCEYGCCKLTFNYGGFGEWIVYYCCPCEESCQ